MRGAAKWETASEVGKRSRATNSQTRHMLPKKSGMLPGGGSMGCDANRRVLFGRGASGNRDSVVLFSTPGATLGGYFGR
jgi:hypothetical protein